MPILVDATYEGGTLKLKQPLPLREHQTVRITIDDPESMQVSRAQASYGMVGWRGDAESVRLIAVEPGFDELRPPVSECDQQWIAPRLT